MCISLPYYYCQTNLLFLLCVTYLFLFSAHGASRHLLAVSNDSSHLPEWERCDYEQNNKPYAWLFNHIVCILIIFIGKYTYIFLQVVLSDYNLSFLMKSSSSANTVIDQ